MNILEVNRNILANLYEQYPESFKGLTMDGNFLVYNGETCDISNFNINDLLYSDNHFAASLSVLTAEDIFKIIRLHALKVNSELEVQKKDDNEEKVEVIKAENPLMKSISIVKRKENGFTYEYFNLVDSQGRDHLFRNDRAVDIFAVYEELKLTNGTDVTPDQLIEAINRKLYKVKMDDARDIIDKPTTSEDFKTKMTRVNEPYKDEKTMSVTGNEEHDIAIVVDTTDNNKHNVVTFDQNEFGDLLLKENKPNVSGIDTTTTVNDGAQSTETDDLAVGNSSEYEVVKKEEEKIEIRLIPIDEFYRLLNSAEDLTEEQRKNVDLYYAYFGDLILYEDYLMPELREMLTVFRAYVYDLQYGEREIEINQKQQEVVDKLTELEVKELEPNKTAPEKVEEKIKKLELIRKNSQEQDNAGSISTMQVIAFIIGVAIILTAITLYLIG